MQSVFIIGYPRSGTTFLLHLLMSSGSFPQYDFDETHFFSHCYRRYGSLARPQNLSRFKSDAEKTGWILRTQISLESIACDIQKTEYQYGKIFEAAMEKIAADQGYSRWLEKTPWHMLYVEEIKQSIPDAKFILIVRDPRDVVLSIEGYGWNGGVLKGVVRSAISWRWHMQTALKSLRKFPKDFLTVRYEDLLLDSEAASAKISKFLNLSIDLEGLNKKEKGVLNKSNSSYSDSAKNTTSIYRWKQAELGNTLPALDYVLSDFLDRFGYEKARVEVSFLKKILIACFIFGFDVAKRTRLMLFPLVRK